MQKVSIKDIQSLAYTETDHFACVAFLYVGWLHTLFTIFQY